jgi:hypothetical protein
VNHCAADFKTRAGNESAEFRHDISSTNMHSADKPSFAHRSHSRPRAAFTAASRIWAKNIPLPFLLASTPLSDRVLRCTRTVMWSPSRTYSSLSPGLIHNALRIFLGIVVCPLLVTVECGIVQSLLS